MALEPDPTSVVGVSDIQENTSTAHQDTLHSEVAEQATLEVHEDTDSRASLAGHKRNLESTHRYETGSDEEIDERSRKRVKDHHHPPLVQEQLMTNIASPSIRVSSPSRLEVDKSHQAPASELSVFKLLQQESEKCQAVGAESLFSLVSKGSEAREPAPTPFRDTQQVAMPSTWNGGVSSSLRTSFGRKKRLPSGFKSTPTGASGLEGTACSVDPVSGSSVSSTLDADSYAALPFRELTRDEQENLSGEEKSLYLKALFAQLREPAPKQSGSRAISHSNSHSSAEENDDGNEEASLPPVWMLEQPDYVKPLSKAETQDLGRKDLAAHTAAFEAHKQAKTKLKQQSNASTPAKIAKIAKAANTPSRKTYNEHVAESNNASIAAESDSWIVDDNDKQSELLERRTWHRHSDGDGYKTTVDTSLDETRENGGLCQSRPFIKLNSDQLFRLKPEDRNAYEVALTSHLQQKLEEATKEVAAAIVKGYPLSEENANAKKLMEAGLTLYPRRRRPPKYSNKTGTWPLHEIFSIDGKPLQIHEFSYNKFAPYLLSQFTSKWQLMTQKMLSGAFNIYICSWYSHLLGMTIFEKSRATLNAINLDDARAAANKLLEQQNALKGWHATSQIRKQAKSVLAPANTSGQHHPIADEEPVDLELGQAELYLQRKYYPSSDLNILHCLACSKSGHNILACPLITCKVCTTSGDHSEAMCPQKRRCQKCGERGHDADICKEKLSQPKSEMTCDICSSSDHLEMACHYVWRSFDPRPEEISIVQDILVNCYNCGLPGHFGPECGLHRGVVYSGGLTWSKHNLQRYVDPSSNAGAIFAGKDNSIPVRAPKKGNALDPITIDESEDEAFIRSKVLPTHPKRGKIHVQQEQKQKGPPPTQRPRRKDKPKPERAPYHRSPNLDGASRADYFGGSTFTPAPRSAPSGPRAGANKRTRNANRGGIASRPARGGGGGGRGRGGGGGGGGLSKEDIGRMADQAGARNNSSHP